MFTKQLFTKNVPIIQLIYADIFRESRAREGQIRQNPASPTTIWRIRFPMRWTTIQQSVPPHHEWGIPTGYQHNNDRNNVSYNVDVGPSPTTLERPPRGQQVTFW